MNVEAQEYLNGSGGRLVLKEVEVLERQVLPVSSFLHVVQLAMVSEVPRLSFRRSARWLVGGSRYWKTRDVDPALSVLHLTSAEMKTILVWWVETPGALWCLGT